MSIRSQAQIQFTPTVVLEILNYLRHGEVSAGLSAASTRPKRLAGFTFVHNTLTFGTEIVIPTDLVEHKIKEVYEQNDTVGKGINQTTLHPQFQYLGITQKK